MMHPSFFVPSFPWRPTDIAFFLSFYFKKSVGGYILCDSPTTVPSAVVFLHPPRINVSSQKQMLAVCSYPMNSFDNQKQSRFEHLTLLLCNCYLRNLDLLMFWFFYELAGMNSYESKTAHSRLGWFFSPLPTTPTCRRVSLLTNSNAWKRISRSSAAAPPPPAHKIWL